MACTNCDKVEEIPISSGLPYLLGIQSTVQGRDGRHYPVNTCLVPKLYSPSGGWDATFYLKGQKVIASGSGSREVFAQTKEIFRLNEIPASSEDLWFNLNIQWTERSIESNRNVSLTDLLALAEPTEPADQGAHEIKRWSAKDWSSKVWGLVETYLAQSVYQYTDFLSIISLIGNIFNPTDNPHLGHASCYRTFNTFSQELIKDPIYDQNEARHFFFNLQKSVNDVFKIVTATYEETAEKNHWT